MAPGWPRAGGGLTLKSLSSVISIIASIAVCGVVGSLGYMALRSDVRARIYQDRLGDLGASYRDLRDHYNDAVRQTAVSELIVSDGRLSVRWTTADGASTTRDTPFDPSSEVYVDYVVRDGRLYLRRIFDASTAPSDAMTLDDGLAGVDWASQDPRDRLAVGKAVYRSLGEGRWVVSVTGDGSLGLVRAGDADDPPARLGSAPDLDTFERIEEEIDDELRDVSGAELMTALLQRLGVVSP